MAIYVKYQNNINKSFDTFQEITDYDEVINLYCCAINLDKLPSLPKKLQKLECAHNFITKLENLPETLTELICDNNCIKKIK
jgi:hypothetical protein